MASRSHNLLRVMLAGLLMLAVCSVVSADPDYKQLKTEIKQLEKSVTDARKERDEVDRKLADNRNAQRTADGAALKALKTEATRLAATAGDKADELIGAQQKLADKQGELRGTAAAHAVKQLTATGNVEDRVGEANNAVSDWKSALGTLPDVPSLRSLDGLDAEERVAVRQRDKKSLEAFDKWAANEESRIDKEIKQVQQIIDGKSKLAASKDGGEALVDAATSLKSTLETRKTKVAGLRKTAKDRIKQVK